jgi:hypothetical protein
MSQLLSSAKIAVMVSQVSPFCFMFSKRETNIARDSLVLQHRLGFTQRRLQSSESV